MDFTMEGVFAVASRFGPNLMSALTTMTLTEIHRFLGYRVEDEVAPKADGPIADTMHTVQRPLAKQRQADIAAYQEATLLSPAPLSESIEQGYQPAVTLMANRALSVKPVPGVSNMMGMAYVSITKDEDTMVVVSDGVGRVSGLEFLERKYQKGGDAEFRQKRSQLDSLRIPVLILFPMPGGELTEEHMQQALYDQNVLATPLQPSQALNMDHRSPYVAVFRGMFTGESEHFGLTDFGVNWSARAYGPNVKDLFVVPPMLKFVKIATEGPKFAESARGSGGSLDQDGVPEASRDLAFFWATVISSAKAFDATQFLPETMKGNMAVSGPGLTALALVSYELFRGERGKSMTPSARLEAMKKVGYRNWTREAEEWQTLGIVEKVSSVEGKPDKYVIHGAGASNARTLTAHFMREAGLAPAKDSDAPTTEAA